MTIIARVPSSRDPQVVYELSRDPISDSFACTCPGYGYRATCRHVTEYAARGTRDAQEEAIRAFLDGGQIDLDDEELMRILDSVVVDVETP